MDTIIETNQLSKHYKNVKAVDQLSLRVKQGEIYAFLGLNGAGKTTTIRMLLGMIKPTNGSVDIMGRRIMSGENEPWKDVGYLVETANAYPELTVQENLEVSRRLHPGTSSARISEIITQLNLDEYAHRKTSTLSLGNAQRLGLAKALLHHPKLLILDEPANGLDPAGVVEIRDLLLSLTRQEGITVFMSSHILGEVSKLAQRIGIIHNGCLLQEMSISELGSNRHRRLLVRTGDNFAAEQILAANGCGVVEHFNGFLSISANETVEFPEKIAVLLVNAGYPPAHLAVEEEDLEDYFLRLVGCNGEVK